MKSLKGNYLALILSLISINIYSQESKDMKSASAEEKALMSYMTPGKMHEMLAKSTGVWTEAVTMWMSHDAPPMKSNMTTMNRMVMGNRYLQGMHRGNFNSMAFEGISTVGYDNAKNIFMSTWIDNMGTGIMYMEGKWNEVSKSIEFNGTMVDPMSGTDMKIRQIMKFVDDNNQLLQMYATPKGGKEYKSMEIKYSKKQEMRSSFSKTPPPPVTTPVPQEKKN